MDMNRLLRILKLHAIKYTIVSDTSVLVHERVRLANGSYPDETITLYPERFEGGRLGPQLRAVVINADGEEENLRNWLGY